MGSRAQGLFQHYLSSRLKNNFHARVVNYGLKLSVWESLCLNISQLFFGWNANLVLLQVFCLMKCTLASPLFVVWCCKGLSLCGLQLYYHNKNFIMSSLVICRSYRKDFNRMKFTTCNIDQNSTSAIDLATIDCFCFSISIGYFPQI